jgi:hypothetical protein
MFLIVAKNVFGYILGYFFPQTHLVTLCVAKPQMALLRRGYVVPEKGAIVFSRDHASSTNRIATH